MPDVDQIPNASDMQQQLAGIEKAIAALQDKATVIAIGVSAPPIAPEAIPEGTWPTATRVELYPPISDPTAITNIIAALEGQKQALITELESWGYTYTGSATPPLPDPATVLSMPHGLVDMFVPPPPGAQPPPQTIPPPFPFKAEPVMPGPQPQPPPPLVPVTVPPPTDVEMAGNIKA